MAKPGPETSHGHLRSAYIGRVIERDRIGWLRAELKSIEAELGSAPAWPASRPRRPSAQQRRLRARHDQVSELLFAELWELPATERVNENIGAFALGLCADGRLGRIELTRLVDSSRPNCFRISHRHGQPSLVQMSASPLELLKRTRMISLGDGHSTSRALEEIVVDDDPRGPTSWVRALSWVRADLLRASYGPNNPHPLYEPERSALVEARSFDPTTPPPRSRWGRRLRAPGERRYWLADADGRVRLRTVDGRLLALSAIERRVIRVGEMTVSGTRRQAPLSHDFWAVSAAHDLEPPDRFVPSAEGAMSWWEGQSSPRQEAARKHTRAPQPARRARLISVLGGA